MTMLVGIPTDVFDASRAGTIVAAQIDQTYLVIFGLVGLSVPQCRSRTCRTAPSWPPSPAWRLVVLVATQLGVFAGLLLLAGAVWSLASTR